MTRHLQEEELGADMNAKADPSDDSPSGPAIALLVMMAAVVVYFAYTYFMERQRSAALAEERVAEQRARADFECMISVHMDSFINQTHDQDEIRVERKAAITPGIGVDPRLKALFDSIDTDGSGALGRDEIAALIARQGMAVDRRFVDGVLDAFDADGSGEIELEEFAALYAVLSKQARSAQSTII